MDFDSNAPDLEPLAKRARLDTSDTNAAFSSIHSPITGVLEQDGDDAEDDFYGDDAPHESVNIANGGACADLPQNQDRLPAEAAGGIPGLLMMTSDESGDAAQSREDDEVSRQLEVEHTASRDVPATSSPFAPVAAPGATLPTDKVSPQTTVPEIAAPHPEPVDANIAAVGEDTTMEDAMDAVVQTPAENREVGAVAEVTQEAAVQGGDKQDEKPEQAEEDVEEIERDGETDTTQVKGEPIDPAWIASMLSGNAEKPQKPPPDPEFLAMAEAQRDDENAEWRYDTSDAESSDSDSSSDSGSDSDDESGDEGYSGMKPEEIAKVLMQEDFNDDGPGGPPGPLRTKNEVPEDEKVERPTIVVTPEMKIAELGKVESTVDNMALIKASVAGDFQVLSEGSLLVLDDRSVIGVVADTLGRVEEPLYTVRFNSADEIKELKVEEGKKVYYVPDHSTYVFTKPLLAQKGTDASNLYDEEAAESEQEFSDDEAEAESKRKKKEARKATAREKNPTKDKKPNSAPSWAPTPPAPTGPATLNYDEPYVPLQRPANLHEMASQPPPPLPSSLRGRGGRGGKNDRGDRGGFRGRGNDRGNARGGNRGRGNEARGRGGNDRGARNERGRGNDRGGHGNERGRGAYDRGGHDGGRGGHNGERGGHDGGRGGNDGGRGGYDANRGRGGRENPRNRSPRAQRDQFKHDSPPGNSNFNQQHHNQLQGHQQNQQNPQFQASALPSMPQFPGFPVLPLPQAQGGQNQGWQQPLPFPPFPQFPMSFPFPVPPIPPTSQAPLPSGAHVNPHFFGGSHSPPAAPPPPPQQQQQQQQQQPQNQVPIWMQGFGIQPQNFQAPQANSDDAFRALQNTLAMLKQNQQNQQQ